MGTKKEKIRKNKSVKGVVAGSAIAAAAAAGLTLGSLFSSPSDLLNKEIFVSPPFEISDTMICDNDGEGPDFSEDEQQEKKQRGIKAALRRFILRLPIEVRAFVCVPVWVIGKILLTVLGKLFQGVLSPALLTILKYFCIAGLIFAAFILSVKAVFPDVPLKKIVTGRKIAVSAIISILFGAVGVILQIFYPEAMKTYEIIESGLLTVIVAFIGVGILKIRSNIKKNGMTA